MRIKGKAFETKNHTINKNSQLATRTPQPVTRFPQYVTRTPQRATRSGMALMAVLAIVVSLCFVYPGLADAASEGPNSGSNAMNEAPVGIYAWSSTGNVFASDNSNAGAYNLPNLKQTNNLLVTGFGFAIPGGSTINGIEVAIERREAGKSSFVVIRDNLVSMIKGGTVTGDNKASGADWPGTDGTATYGSSSDTWGEAWTSGDINAADFGVAISAKAISSLGFGNEHAYIDHITITVHYTLAGGCTTNAPLVEILDAPQTITADNGSVNYDVRITNQDVGGACANPLAINLSTGDSNPNFSSSIGSPVNLAPGANTTVSLTVTEATAITGENTTTTVTATAAAHPNGTDNVVTTYLPPPPCTVNPISVTVTEGPKTITVDNGNVSYNVDITNNDVGAGCTDPLNILIFNGDSNANFTSSIVGSVNLSPGATQTLALVVNEATAISGETTTTTVTVSSIGHANQQDTILTTYLPAVSCTVNIPTLQVTPVTKSVVAGGTVDYIVSVRNNDTLACAPTTFNLNVVSDTNGVDFTIPSTLNPVSLNNLAPGTSGTSTLTVTSQATAIDGNTNDTEVEVTAAGHASPPNVIMTTTVGNPLLHNSVNTGSAYWGGDWGLNALSKYGQFVCETCHIKSTTNIKRIRENITAPNSPVDDFPGGAGAPVLFKTAEDGTSDYGDDSDAHTTSNRICEVCHSQPDHHRYDTTGQTDGLNHNNRTDCMTCHKHNLGFKVSCEACHGYPPIDAGTLIFADKDSAPVVSDSLGPGAHAAHIAAGKDCVNCHTGGMLSGPAAGDDLINIGFNLLGNLDGNYDGKSGRVVFPYVGGGTTTVSAGDTLACSNIYCHGNYPGSGLNASPQWDIPASGACGTCHGAENTQVNVPASGSHERHAGDGDYSSPLHASGFKSREYSCTLCHNGIVAGSGPSSWTIADQSKHVNSFVDWAFDETDVRLAISAGLNDYPDYASGTVGPTDGNTGAGNRAFGITCTVYCHSNVQPD
ncbi:MAG: CxxxxCH/CxxCH domain c-type cytochrome, partial [Planctomycetota bacterium]